MFVATPGSDVADSRVLSRAGAFAGTESGAAGRSLAGGDRSDPLLDAVETDRGASREQTHTSIMNRVEERTGTVALT
jgi:hypothetical protein